MPAQTLLIVSGTMRRNDHGGSIGESHVNRCRYVYSGRPVSVRHLRGRTRRYRRINSPLRGRRHNIIRLLDSRSRLRVDPTLVAFERTRRRVSHRRSDRSIIRSIMAPNYELIVLPNENVKHILMTTVAKTLLPIDCCSDPEVES